MSEPQSEGEAIYDAEIAPKLLEVAELCKKYGFPMVATVWFDGESSGTTHNPPVDKPNPCYTLAIAANRCFGNLDRLCFGLAKQVRPEHNGSIVLHMLKGMKK